MAIAPINNPNNQNQTGILTQFFRDGSQSLSTLLSSAIQVGRDQANLQASQERDFLGEQRREMGLFERRGIQQRQNYESDRRFLEDQYQFDTKFGEDQRQFDVSQEGIRARFDIENQRLLDSQALAREQNETANLFRRQDSARADARLGLDTAAASQRASLFEDEQRQARAAVRTAEANAQIAEADAAAVERGETPLSRRGSTRSQTSTAIPVEDLASYQETVNRFAARTAGEQELSEPEQLERDRATAVLDFAKQRGMTLEQAELLGEISALSKAESRRPLTEIEKEQLADLRKREQTRNNPVFQLLNMGRSGGITPLTTGGNPNSIAP